MADFKRFDLNSPEDLRRELEELSLELPMGENISILGDRVLLGKKGKTGKWQLPNRFVTQPMEGFDAQEENSSPSELTFRRYKRFAAGGAGLIWFEAAVISPESRSNPRQLMLTEKSLDEWKRLVEETRQTARDTWGHDIVTVLQLAHSGRWSKPEGRPKPVLIHHNPVLDAAVGSRPEDPLISDDELQRLSDLFIENSILAARAGFDGVEMKAVHGYLSAELLCAHTRPGRYGGSYENRTRLVRDCTEGMRQAMSSSHFVTARLTLYEPSAYPFGWGTKAETGSLETDFTEPIRFARELVNLTDMPVFNYSLGYPRFQPYVTRPYNNPIAGDPVSPEHPLEGIVRFQKAGRDLQAALGDVPLVTAALGWLRHLMPWVAAGLVENDWVQLIGQGRQSFAYPDSVADILKKGRLDPGKCCITCSLCSQIMKDGLGRNGCPVKDGDIYRKELKRGRAAAKARGVK